MYVLFPLPVTVGAQGQSSGRRAGAGAPSGPATGDPTAQARSGAGVVGGGGACRSSTAEKAPLAIKVSFGPRAKSFRRYPNICLGIHVLSPEEKINENFWKFPYFRIFL